MTDSENISVLLTELEWLQKVIGQAIKSYFLQEGHEADWREIAPPDLTGSETPYGITVNKLNLDIYERVSLALVLAPQFKPEVLDIFYGRNRLYDRMYTEFGGITDKTHSGLLPTIQTLCFLLAGSRTDLKAKAFSIVSNSGKLVEAKLLRVEQQAGGTVYVGSLISLTDTAVNYFVTGTANDLKPSDSFPAHEITTSLERKDLILNEQTKNQLEEIELWIKHEDTLLNQWNLRRLLNAGYKALFYGPPGTGKTLSAAMLGKCTGMKVFRIDLSMMVSKYIGETEKNLSRIFESAAESNAILFFDEADSLFGARTATNSSNDRYANQQTGYLLQKIETYPGVIILATNLKDNIDTAFTRRFQSIINFPLPTIREREKLWKNIFSGYFEMDVDVDFGMIAEQHELSGGAITNVLRYCALKAAESKSNVILYPWMLQAIQKEYRKEHKVMILSNLTDS
ncbi:MAG: ATP-binding protein [Bacteroidia bacterium]|nr:ATP-binding protein [Bacteroidota bacterium]MBP9082872.1 ATP-binding protein [Bacteroidia bacterium]